MADCSEKKHRVKLINTKHGWITLGVTVAVLGISGLSAEAATSEAAEKTGETAVMANPTSEQVATLKLPVTKSNDSVVTEETAPVQSPSNTTPEQPVTGQVGESSQSENSLIDNDQTTETTTTTSNNASAGNETTEKSTTRKKITVDGLDASSAKVKDLATNKEVDPSATTDKWGAYQASYNWKIDDDVHVNAGDTATINLPDNFQPDADAQFDIKSEDGTQTAGSVAVTAGSRTATMTFTDYFAQNTTGREGTLDLLGRGTEIIKVPLLSWEKQLWPLTLDVYQGRADRNELYDLVNQYKDSVLQVEGRITEQDPVTKQPTKAVWTLKVNMSGLPAYGAITSLLGTAQKISTNSVGTPTIDDVSVKVGEYDEDGNFTAFEMADSAEQDPYNNEERFNNILKEKFGADSQFSRVSETEFLMNTDGLSYYIPDESRGWENHTGVQVSFSVDLTTTSSMQNWVNGAGVQPTGSYEYSGTFVVLGPRYDTGIIPWGGQATFKVSKPTSHEGVPTPPVTTPTDTPTTPTTPPTDTPVTPETTTPTDTPTATPVPTTNPEPETEQETAKKKQTVLVLDNGVAPSRNQTKRAAADVAQPGSTRPAQQKAVSAPKSEVVTLPQTGESDQKSTSFIGTVLLTALSVLGFGWAKRRKQAR
ncbi:hypothetical protein FC96_GL000898 [Secundilactobacillus kimchicus JCM 15530]|uniref:Gram-positive cocci surface proteins LPxTG domain-containing protein n=1 Tax=Secundilactobacillus kimchicus JCM 15530 TaxID=1302272 RepID=A0A0R1HKR7_9LACO|nr:hypothetical protein FC96_GL000898 [Secundilactobacillus kimchicus JCM 15530]